MSKWIVSHDCFPLALGNFELTDIIIIHAEFMHRLFINITILEGVTYLVAAAFDEYEFHAGSGVDGI
jgi:hypothetical protein